MERIKLLLQTQDINTRILSGQSKRYLGLKDCLSRVIREEGILELWRGNSANILRYFPTQALNFAFKDTFRKWLCPYNAKKEPFKYFLGSLAAGGAAGGVALSIVYPLDFVRTRLAADIGKDKNERQFNGLRDCISKIYKSEGTYGLYRGFVVSVIGIIIYRAFYFGGFDTAKRLIIKDKEKNNFLLKFGIAQSCTAFAGILSYPLDTVKRRLMMQSGRKDIIYKGTIDCIIKIQRNEGGKSFFKGAFTNFIRGIGASLVLVFYDELHIYISRHKLVN